MNKTSSIGNQNNEGAAKMIEQQYASVTHTDKILLNPDSTQEEIDRLFEANCVAVERIRSLQVEILRCESQIKKRNESIRNLRNII